MDKQTIKTQFEKEGFKHVYEWTDAAGTEYPSHSHKDKVVLYIANGSIDLHIDGQMHHLAKGSRFDVPPGVPHTAKVGADGCEFVVGEMIEGDS